MTSAEATAAGPDAASARRVGVCGSRCTLFCLMFFILLSALLAAAAVVGFAFSRARACGPAVCTTPECIEVGAFITQNLNLSADPCEDFFQFACGGYVERNRFDSKSINTGIGAFIDMIRSLRSKVFELLYLRRRMRSSDAEISELYDLTRDMFHSCMQWHGAFWAQEPNLPRLLDPLFDLVTDGIRTNQLRSLDTFLGKLARAGVSGVAQLHIGSDDYELMLAAETADQGGGANITRVRLSSDVFGFKGRWNASQLLPILQYFGRNNSFEFAKILSLNDSVTELVAVQNRLFEFTADHDAQFGNESDSFVGEVQEFERKYPFAFFSWRAFFEAALGVPLSATTAVMVDKIGWLNRTIGLLGPPLQAPSGYGSSYAFVLLHAMLTFEKFFPKELRQQVAELMEADDPITDLSGTADDLQYPRYCMHLTMTSMQPVVVDMFIKTYLKEGFSSVHTIIEDIKVAMQQSVDTENWISNEGKRAIKGKIRAIKESVGYNPMSPEMIKEFFKEARERYEPKKQFGHFLGLCRGIDVKKVTKIMTSNSSLSFFAVTTPLQVNAFNFMDRNTIIFPMGILGPYLYDPAYPVYLRYGGLGSVIGHEIGHSFDNRGHSLTESGQEGHFWDTQTEDGFQQRVACLRKSYSSFELGNGVQLDGNSTVGNNIADILGISSAYRALTNRLRQDPSPKRLPGILSSLTPEMMFFVQFAQIWCEKVTPEAYVERYSQPTHSPPKLRVLGTLRNSREFAQAFACDTGRRMNPQEKCRLW